MPWSNLPNGAGDVNLFTCVLAVLLSLWGGFINYLGRIRQGAMRFSLVELAIELAISSFAGLTVGLMALSLHVSPLMTLAMAGLAGHAGGRTVFFLDRWYKRRLRSLTDERGE
jgi:hypothetical protein